MPLLASWMVLLRLLVAVSIIAASSGCGSRLKKEHRVSAASLVEKYENQDSENSLWLVEWDPTEKVRLQTLSKQGVLPVIYQDGRLELLRECTLAGEYRFSTAPKIKNREYIRNKTDLLLKFPLGAVSLGAEYKKGDVWSLDYVLVGSRDATLSRVHVNDLSGKCRKATHFIQGMVVGAYRLSAVSTVGGSGEAGAFQVGLGGTHANEAAMIREAGDMETCADHEHETTGEGCHATIRLYLDPIEGRKPVAEKKNRGEDVVLDLGILAFTKNELVFFPHFVMPGMGISTMELGSDIPPGIQKQWSDMMRREQAHRRVLLERFSRLNEIEGERRACHSLKTGCSVQYKFAAKKAGLVKQYDQRARDSQKALSVRKQRLNSLLHRELKKRQKKKKNIDSVAVALAGITMSIEYDEVMESATSPLPKRDAEHNATVDLLKTAVENNRPESVIGWWARFLLANRLIESEKEAAGIALLATIAQTRWRPETIQVLFVLGNYHMEVSGDASTALQTYLQMAEVAKKFDDQHAFGIATVLSALAAFQVGRYADALSIALSILKDPGQRSLHGHLCALAAECVEHLGGLDKEPLAQVPPDVFAQIATIMAHRAVARHGLNDAKVVWQGLLERAPQSLYAASALEGLRAVAEQQGDTHLAQKLAKRRATEFSVDSEWANNLRKMRNEKGYPSDEAISFAVSAMPPPLPSTPRDEEGHRKDVFARLKGLYSHCFASATKINFKNVDVSIEVLFNDEEQIQTNVTLTPRHAEGDLVHLTERVRSCFERDSPRYFSGLSRSFRAVIAGTARTAEFVE